MDADFGWEVFVFSIGVHQRSSAANLVFAFFSNLWQPARDQRCDSTYFEPTKILFGIIPCTPLVPSTNCVMSKSTATLAS